MLSSRPSRGTRRVCPWMLRAHFNEDQVMRLITEGQVIEDPEPGTVPKPQAKLPNGTYSHTVWIRTLAGAPLYRTHCYVCPHGNLLGPTGFLDPKDMYLPTEILKNDRRHRDNDTCAACGMWKPRAQQALRALAAYSRRCQTCP